MISSNPLDMKSAYWNSATGRRPSIAAPTAMPTIVSSAIGVSITRVGAEAVEEPLGHLEGAAVDADVLAEHEDALVALHLFPQRLGDRDEIGGLAVLGALAAGFGAMARRAGFDLSGRHQPASVPPPRPGSNASSRPRPRQPFETSPGSGNGDASA